MSDDDMKNKGFTTIGEGEDIPQEVLDSEVVVTIKVRDVKELQSMAIEFEWADSVKPSEWDLNDLGYQQMFLITLLSQIENVGTIMRAVSEGVPKNNPLRAVTRDNIDEIMKEIEDIDKNDMH